MAEEEIPRAIEFEARHHIPLPLSEVVFDWQIIEKEQVSPGVKLKILLVAVPNKVLDSYQRLAALCNLEVKGLEAEVFGLIRSSIKAGKHWGPVCLIDIGWQSTTVSIVDKMILRASHSFDFSSSSLTRALSQALGLSEEQAEDLKTRGGLDPKNEQAASVLLKEIDTLAVEVEKICANFSQAENNPLNDVILAGGAAMLFGLKEYFTSRLKKTVQVTNPFSVFVYPPILQARLEEISPSFAVASGAAMMALDT
jgi:type IV pilus assembly protein PilM